MPLDPLHHPFCSLGNNPQLLASSESLPSFVLLIFATSSVGKLSVCNCLERFLYLDPFGSIWSYLWLSGQVLVFLVSIFSFLVLVCHEWKWIFGTRNHVFHHGLAFDLLLLLLLLFNISFLFDSYWKHSEPGNIELFTQKCTIFQK